MLSPFYTVPNPAHLRRILPMLEGIGGDLVQAHGDGVLAFRFRLLRDVRHDVVKRQAR